MKYIKKYKQNKREKNLRNQISWGYMIFPNKNGTLSDFFYQRMAIKMEFLICSEIKFLLNFTYSSIHYS